MNPLLYIRLSALFFLQFFIWGSWYVTTGTYLLGTIGFSGREVGLVYGATAIAATVSPFLLGSVADRLFATERLLAGLHFFGGLFMFGLSFLQTFSLFYPVLIAYALFYMPTFALSTALTFHHLDSGSRHFPRVRVWGTLGWVAVGLAISYFDLEPTAAPLRISAAASLAAAVFCLTLPHTPPQPRAGRRSLRDVFGPEILDLLRQPSFAVLIGSLVLISIPTGFYYSFTNSFLTEAGVANPAAKMSVGQMTEVVVMLVLPWCFTHLGVRRVFAIGLFTWGFRYTLFAFGNSQELMGLLWTGLLLHGVAFNFTALTGQIYVDQLAPAHLRGTAQGFVSLVTMGLGTLIGAYIAGEVVEYYSLPGGGHHWRAIWLTPAMVGMVVSGLFLRFFRTG